MPLPPMSVFQRNAVALARKERAFFSELVALRKRSGRTASEVAKVLGRHRSAVTRFENMQGDPRLSTVLRYAAAVGAMIEVRVSELPEWEEPTRRQLDVQGRGNVPVRKPTCAGSPARTRT